MAVACWHLTGEISLHILHLVFIFYDHYPIFLSCFSVPFFFLSLSFLSLSPLQWGRPVRPPHWLMARCPEALVVGRWPIRARDALWAPVETNRPGPTAEKSNNNSGVSALYQRITDEKSIPRISYVTRMRLSSGWFHRRALCLISFYIFSYYFCGGRKDKCRIHQMSFKIESNQNEYRWTIENISIELRTKMEFLVQKKWFVEEIISNQFK